MLRRYLEKIEDRNNELLRLKLTTGNTVQVLNTLKHKLHNLTAESEWLKRETSTRKESLAKISEEIGRVEQEKEQAARQDRKLKREENTESNMPQVLDYVQQKAEQYEVRLRPHARATPPRLPHARARHARAIVARTRSRHPPPACR